LPSALVFAAINFVYYTVAFANYNLVTLTCYGLLIVLIISFALTKSGSSMYALLA
jgi:hypothetical protein